MPTPETADRVMAEDKDKKKKPEGKGGAPKGAQQQKQQKQPKKPKPTEAQQDDAGADEGAPQQPAPPPRLIAHYREKVVPALTQQFGYTNVLAVPRLEKIVISMGLGKAVTAGEKGKMETAEKELGIIAGQRPVKCKAKKSV